MKPSTRTFVKNLVVAITFGVAAIATWAVTRSDAPLIEASTMQVQNG